MPAAAVIPAPIAYIKVVAVKKLVVEFWIWLDGLALLCVSTVLIRSFLLGNQLPLTVDLAVGSRTFTLKKLECSKQAFCLEYISME